MGKQVEFALIIEQSAEQHRRAIDRYIEARLPSYRKAARRIRPNLRDEGQIRARIAFAILTANAPFQASVDALAYCKATNWQPEPEGLLRFAGMTPAKADYIRQLPQADCIFGLLKQPRESWKAYRLRLKASVKGLGLAKASFAAAMLYPTRADLACIDTHMQQVFLGHSAFKSIGLKAYEQAEEAVRQVAKRHHVMTFLAQWMIWDHKRGQVENHDIFPGTHKQEAAQEIQA